MNEQLDGAGKNLVLLKGVQDNPHNIPVVARAPRSLQLSISDVNSFTECVKLDAKLEEPSEPENDAKKEVKEPTNPDDVSDFESSL